MIRAGKFRPPVFAILFFVVALCPAPAEAHLISTGMGPIYDGLTHFAASPEDLVPALALALLAGLRGAAYGRRALFVLPAAWLVGGLAGLAAANANASAALTAISFVLLGGLVTLDARVSLNVTTALAGLLGLYHGYLNGSGMSQPGAACLTLLGLVFAVFVLVALAASLVVQLRAAWTRIAVRVIGSWDRRQRTADAWLEPAWPALMWLIP